MPPTEINIGLLGAGVVGSGTLDVLWRRRERIAAAVGCPLEVRRVLVRDPGRPRPVAIPAGLLTTDPSAILEDPAIPIVVELMGGIEPAHGYIAAALRAGKHVVTANKDVIATYGYELFRLANDRGVNLFFEGSVGGGIPVVTTLRHGLVANQVGAIQAIINGTTNYILTAMEQDRDYADALREAQQLGYAEANPRNDVEGIDAAYKLAILSTLAFRSEVRPIDVRHFGITRLQAKDFRYAAEMGYVIKLIAASRLLDGQIEAGVYPALLPRTHHLASVKGVFNAILIDGDQIDTLMLYGRGAGAQPTASAVVADICTVARDLIRGVVDRIDLSGQPRPVVDFDDTESRYYIRMQVADQPGVLAQIARVLGDGRISIASVIQKETDETARSAELVIMTHAAQHRGVVAALEAIGHLAVVRDISNVLRVLR
ncbi:MAG: homoserine dehydrogenase [Chloroflexi bacterium]|nr:homoserine dehydrogenase [Chloroflexota bacterium]